MSKDILKEKIRREGRKLTIIGLIWLATAILLQIIGVLDWMNHFSEGLPYYLSLPFKFFYLCLAPGLWFPIAGIYQWISNNRTRTAKAIFGELLTQEERAKHVPLKETPEQPLNKSKALTSCPFCAGTNLTHSSEENHCEACGAIWKVMAPLGMGAAFKCIFFAFLFSIPLLQHFAERESSDLGNIVLLIVTTAIGLGCLVFACAILITRKREHGVKIITVRKPLSRTGAQP